MRSILCFGYNANSEIYYLNKKGNTHWIGDGYCDDINNKAECMYDGGDCCLDIVLTDYCTLCQCLERKNC